MPELRFFPDHQADPVWTADGRMVSLDSLPISGQTRVALRAWSERWAALAWREMAADDYEAGETQVPAERAPQSEWQSLRDEGRTLCEILRRELGPSYALTYEGI